MQATEATTRELDDYDKETAKSMSSVNHAAVQMRLGIAFSASTGFSVFPELTLELPDGQRLAPDLAVFPKIALNWLHDTVRMKTMPLLAVEILSPTQGFQEIADKLVLYFAHGVKSVWVASPGLQAIAIYLPGIDRPQIFTTGEVKDSVTGLTADLENVFAP